MLTVIDVRAIAQSRKPGFSKRSLAASLATSGIGYVHLRPLGTPKEGRVAARRGDGATLARVYEAHLAGDAAEAGLVEVAALSRVGPACLLCFERDHALCHRSLVASHVAAATGAGIRHLQADPASTALPTR